MIRTFSNGIARDSVFFRADARVKLISAFVLLVMVLSHDRFAFPLAVSCLCLAACAWMKVPLRLFMLRFIEPMFIVSMVVALKFFFSGQEIMFSTSILGVTISGHADGLMEGLKIAVRVLAAVSIVATVGFATPFTEIMAGLGWFRVPGSLIEIMMLAYRYIFLLLEEALVIYNSQKNRLGYSSLRQSLRSFGTLSGTLVLRAFENSQHMATSMAQRGYNGYIPLHDHKPFRVSEVLSAIALILLMAGTWTL